MLASSVAAAYFRPNTDQYRSVIARAKKSGPAEERWCAESEEGEVNERRHLPDHGVGLLYLEVQRVLKQIESVRVEIILKPRR